ncbi:MAG: relaxase/mobilization nuclease domain-containing protein [Halothiobacillaceae bacterium]|nr:relaxase/mobilization nuclease domain-containing protein [Halothiobacillaceae bacterium]
MSYIDDFFESGFRIRQTPKGAKGYSGKVGRRTTARGAPFVRSGTKSKLAGPSARRANMKSVAARAPEVMVKITGSSNGLNSAKNHIDYISRNGEIELEDENGDKHIGNRAVRAYKELLRVQGIPAESKRREFLHVVFSMPKDTPQSEMRKAVTEFCKDEYSNRRYVMAFHDDKDHKHVHVLVGTWDIDRANAARLSPRKRDLAEWREKFAAALRNEGVDAAASPRAARFKVQKQENFKVRQMQEHPRKGYKSHVIDGRRRELKQNIENGTRPENPHEDKIQRRRAEVVDRWQGQIEQSAKEGDLDQVEKIQSLLKDAKAQTASRSQAAFDEQMSSAIKKERGDGLDVE